MTLVGTSQSAPGALSPTSRRWWRVVGSALFVLSCVAVAVIAPVPNLTESLEAMADGNQGLADHYVDQPAPIRTALLVHAGFSGVALLLTPVQWSAAIRRRLPTIHRWSGRVSASAIAVGAASGLVIAQVSYAGLSGRVGFSLLSAIWLWCTAKAIGAARRRRLGEHRRWAIRVMALTFAAVTLRLWLGLWIGLSMPTSDAEVEAAFDQMYAITPFLSWIPNLAVAEWYLRRSDRLADRSRAATVA